MSRLLILFCFCLFAFAETNDVSAQRLYTPPPVSVKPPGTYGTGVAPLPDITYRETFRLQEQYPTIRVPPPPPKVELQQPEVGMCCPCPGTNTCSDICCIRK